MVELAADATWLLFVKILNFGKPDVLAAIDLGNLIIVDGALSVLLGSISMMVG